MHCYDGMQFIKAVISTLTPVELDNIFPIDKTYNGERYQSKDYFYTIRAIKAVGENEEIGDKLNDLLWDYQNLQLTLFTVNLMSVVSDIRRSQGEKGIFEKFAEENGLSTYRVFKDEKGKEFIQDSVTGEVFKARKPIPRYLKVIK